MISYLQGKIFLKKKKFIILDVKGVGFEIFLSNKTLKSIPQIGENLKLFCHLDVGEKSLKLYGFLDYEELEFFKLVRNISGVGPKAALEISSIGSIEKIKEEIEKENVKIFEEIPGIGSKKARKIILELSGKIKEVSKVKVKETDEAENVLIGLGFPRQRVKEVLAKIPKESKNTQERIKQALKILGRR